MAGANRGYHRVEGLEVYVSRVGDVVLKSSEDTGGSVEILIAIPPERVDQVCRWLQECKDEAVEVQASHLSLRGTLDVDDENADDNEDEGSDDGPSRNGRLV